MQRRTKKQILEDDKKILEKKVEALEKLNSHLISFSQLSEEEIEKITIFLFLFMKCETVYKTLYYDMKRIRDDETIDLKTITFNVQKYEAALRYFGIEFNHDKMNTMFSAKKSYLKYRNDIVHGLKDNSITFVTTNFGDIKESMEELLNNVEQGKPVN